MREIEFQQQEMSRLMVVFQKTSKHQDSNARNETNKTSLWLQLRLWEVFDWEVDERYETSS